MFSLTNSPAFWIAAILVVAVAMFVSRKYVKKQMLTAPVASIRNTKQLVMHFASGILGMSAIGYVLFMDGEPFWATLVVIGMQIGALGILQIIGVGYAARTLIIVPLAVTSVLVGALVEVWPATNLTALGSASWSLFVSVGVVMALSSTLSIYSFPLGFGERRK